MRTYKLLREKDGKLYPLFVESKRELPLGEWLEAGVGEMVDDGHVRSKIGPLSLRPGFHSTEIPFTDWIGVKQADGTLAQRPGTVWVECEVSGNRQEINNRYGSRTLPQDWYYFKTNPKQIFPWIISNRIKLIRTLTQNEVSAICRANGVVAQPLAIN